MGEIRPLPGYCAGKILPLDSIVLFVGRKRKNGMKVPFNRVSLSGQEMIFLEDCLKRGTLSGGGYYSRAAQSWLEEYLAGPRVFLTVSGTAALEMAMLCLDIKPGDEVIMPSFTFVSTANAVLLRGGRPVFAEIDPYTLNLYPEDVERRITPRTRAVIPVHYGGIACPMDELLSLAAGHRIAVVEDAAHGMGAVYKGRPLGTMGLMGCYSFHATKNIVSGEGGALLLNERRQLQERAEIIYEKGTDRSQFMRGEVDRYTWHGVGSSFIMADLLAAFLYAQLQQIEKITAARAQRFDNYQQAFSAYQQRGLLQIPFLPEYAGCNYHLYYMLCPSEAKRDDLLQYLRRQGIEATFHFIPLHSSPLGRSLGYPEDELSFTQGVSRRLIRLPLYPDLSQSEQEYVIENVKACLAGW